MNLITTTAFQKALLADLTDNTVGGNHAGTLTANHILLFTNAPNLTSKSVLSDLAEASFNGYARSATVAWNPALLVQNTQWQVSSDVKQFLATDGLVTQTITGYGLVQGGAGTNDVQTLTMGGVPTGGTFTLTWNGQTTATIPFNATAAQVQTALGALTNVGAVNVLATGGPFTATPIVVTFQNALGQAPQPLITANNAGLTGGTTPAVTVAHTTTGVLGAVLLGAALLDTPVPISAAGDGIDVIAALVVPTTFWGGGVAMG